MNISANSRCCTHTYPCYTNPHLYLHIIAAQFPCRSVNSPASTQPLELSSRTHQLITYCRLLTSLMIVSSTRGRFSHSNNNISAQTLATKLIKNGKNEKRRQAEGDRETEREKGKRKQRKTYHFLPQRRRCAP